MPIELPIVCSVLDINFINPNSHTCSLDYQHRFYKSQFSHLFFGLPTSVLKEYPYYFSLIIQRHTLVEDCVYAISILPQIFKVHQHMVSKHVIIAKHLEDRLYLRGDYYFNNIQSVLFSENTFTVHVCVLPHTSFKVPQHILSV